MGLHDRDYMRAGSGHPSYLTGLRTTWWLIGINAGLWMIFTMSVSAASGDPGTEGLSGFIWRYLVLHPKEVLESLRFWQPFTAFWLHDPFGAKHVFFNMLLLYFFGRTVEAYLRRRRYLRLYLGGGLASTLILIPWSYVSGQFNPALGASGAVYAVMVWLACQEPRRTVYVMFVIPMPLWLLVGVVMVGMQVLKVAGPGANVGGSVGHLAGAAWGFAFFRLAARWGPASDAAMGPGAWIVKARTKRAEQSRQREQMEEAEVRVRVDALLDKIKDQGIEALSEEEKQFLQHASKRYR